MLSRVIQVSSLERLLKFYLEGFPRFNLNCKEKERLVGGGRGGREGSVIAGIQPARLLAGDKITLKGAAKADLQ
jgi:hypothetical protein